MKAGETPGFPRFKGEGQSHSLTYVQDTAFSLGEDYIGFSKIGKVKAVIHRRLEGKLKQCVLSQQGLDWWASVIIETKEDPLPENDERIALDMGLEKFAILSNGETIENPRFFRKHEQRLAKAQRKAEREKHHRKRSAIHRRTISRIHKKVRHQRHNFLHQEARKLINRVGTVFLEDLNVKNMSKSPAPKKEEETGAYLPNGHARAPRIA